jgi:type VI protein secretion system component VasA
VREKAGTFGPYIPKLARRALTTPATSAPVERVFSKIALVTTKHRNRLSADSISLTMFLKEAWEKVQSMGLQGAVDGMFSDEEEEV